MTQNFERMNATVMKGGLGRPAGFTGTRQHHGDNNDADLESEGTGGPGGPAGTKPTYFLFWLLVLL